MDEIASIVLKHDGYIWGDYVWSKVCGSEPRSITCRFVFKSVFAVCDSMSIPHHFLIDLKSSFHVCGIKGDKVLLFKDGKEYTLTVRIHTPVEELAFMEATDFTVNLLDYRRDGLSLRSCPTAVSYEVSPYETVLDHIRTKTLVPINAATAVKTCDEFIKLGWSMKKEGYITHLFIGDAADMDKYHYKSVDKECSVCQADASGLCVRTQCRHVFHIECIREWFERHSTCPNCRENIS